MAKPPPFFEVIDSIKVLIEQGEDVPANLLAKLLKFKLLMIKQKDFERREEEKKVTMLDLFQLYTLCFIYCKVSK